MLIIFEKEYDGESLYDASRDFSECFCDEYNEILSNIPKDEHGFQEGTFKVNVTWSNND